MNDLIKARIIIELLDDRKYSVLSSFTDSELAKLNNIDLEELSGLSSAQINGVIAEFLSDIELRISAKTIDSEPEPPKIEKSDSSYRKKSSREKEAPITEPSVTEKIQQQPIQLLACLIHQLDDDKKEFILSNLNEDKMNEVNSISVENTPISAQVINILKKELDLV
ncbi:MAG: hypothetical protein VW397_03485 [Candidatus Margulisiibacteriota bacterium]